MWLHTRKIFLLELLIDILGRLERFPVWGGVQAETGYHLAVIQALYVGLGLDELQNSFPLGVSKSMLLFACEIVSQRSSY